jgi:long-chain-fatty-acid--[acyl-carrier-protein] ligase
MPSHPAYIDPPLVMSSLRLPGGIRPTAVSTMFRNPFLHPMMRLAGTLEVPDLSAQSRSAREQTLTTIDTIVAGLERGENYLLYPSGRAQRRGLEELGGARAAAEILARCPQANVVLVRTRGVWGSMFSYAPTAAPPALGRCALRAIGWLLAGLLLLVPRRKVVMTVEVLDRRKLPELSREKLNRFLEDWYNRGGPEPPTFVRYNYLFGRREFRFPTPLSADRIDTDRIKPATIRAVNELIEERLSRPLGDDEKRPDALLDRIGLDSLDRMDVALQIEDRFGFHSDRIADTLGELWALAEGLLTGSGEGPPPVPAAWNRPPGTGSFFGPLRFLIGRGVKAEKCACPLTADAPDVLAETLAQAFLLRVLEQPDDVAVADRLSGVLTYRRMLVGTRLLGSRLGKLPGAAVGVLLPASVAADLVFFALHTAGKLPAILNWTTGPANLAHAVQTLGITHVVTSRKLIDRLGIEIRGAEYVFLEDVRAEIGKLAAAAALAGTYLFPRRLLRGLPRPEPHDPAVVLFTSGSESAPKAVPLSHRNLITNVRASLAIMGLTHADAILGLLPPFHSFGLMGNLLAPVLGGIRVVHHPDPTDAAGLVQTLAAYRATIAVTTPTFLSYMLALAAPADLASLRIIITGAEKCPEALFAQAKQMAPQAVILEGYGITECSPVVSGNLPQRIKQGSVGPPLPGVEVCVVHPDSHEPLPAGAIGLLLLRGPSIFSGYLNYAGPEPFVEVGGRRWYVTGDLVRLDEDGYIWFCGRLKRFLKVGGEMVSLPAIEEPLAARYPPGEHGPQVAVEGLETPRGLSPVSSDETGTVPLRTARIVLFTTQDLPLRSANAILAEAGFRGVMRLDEVRRVEAIPVLGTGKTDYKLLRRMLRD